MHFQTMSDGVQGRKRKMPDLSPKEEYEVALRGLDLLKELVCTYISEFTDSQHMQLVDCMHCEETTSRERS